MNHRARGRRDASAAAALALLGATFAFAQNPIKPGHWNIDDVRAGMTGYGNTVIKGTQPERFLVNVLSVVKGVTPGRDLVLCRVEGLGLDKTGILSGMSGSPVYIEDKLVGAIAFTWSFGKEPIGGITPFSQMAEYSKPGKPAGPGVANLSYMLHRPLPLPLEDDEEEGIAAASTDARLKRLTCPIAVSGLTRGAISECDRRLSRFGLCPLGGGGGPGKEVDPRTHKVSLEPGGSMAVGLVTGDVSMSAIGTVTAIDGKRVYGFGHPFMGLGRCELPLMTAQIHAVIPRETLSFKLGSPISIVGRLDADASTCVAGQLGEMVDLLPIQIDVKSDTSELDRKFRCQIVRERALLPQLAFIVLGSCSDLDGQPPTDLSAKVSIKLELEGLPPLVMEDLFSGPAYSGAPGLFRIYSPIGNLLMALANNPFHRPKITGLTCKTRLSEGRASARLIRASVEQPIRAAGDDLSVTAWLQPYRPGQLPGDVTPLESVTIKLKLPADLEPGKYSAHLGDAISDLRLELQNRPHLANPTDFSELYEFLSMQLALRRTNLVLRFDSPKTGVAIGGTELPSLPGGVADRLADETSGQVTTLRSSTTARATTSWSLEGSQLVRFEVVKEKRFLEP